ncbi:Hypp7191 [Branchiostoma lanceolatum]|uniref:Hypp7191 protein n=1 Tax=Branchiostoma lanceolatum TaxID=7740 RepID=A0A8J9YYD5_BRALA|nr:Hypp7191 [Branchiostoma lanceolatum]
MDNTRPLLLYCLTIILLTMHTNLCVGADDQVHHVNDESSPFWTEEEANGFLERPSRHKRSLYHECYVEGCSFHEVDEVLSYEGSREYLYTMACDLWPCQTGCTCDKANPGSAGSGPHWRVCNDINECLTNKGGCREDQYCVNTVCGFSCPAESK